MWDNNRTRLRTIWWLGLSECNNVNMTGPADGSERSRRKRQELRKKIKGQHYANERNIEKSPTVPALKHLKKVSRYTTVYTVKAI